MSVWFITGTSRGFGAALTAEALRRGHQVVATARNPKVVAEAHPDAGDRLLAVPLDVTDQHQAADAVRAAVERFGRIDVLVNNAGAGLFGAVEESSDDEVRAQYELNVLGQLRVIRAVAPVMRGQRAGQILNISSLFAVGALHGFGVYSSTKAAMTSLSEALRAELAPFEVSVTAVELGLFRTDFSDESSLRVAGDRLAAYGDGPVAQMWQAVRQVNHHQPGDPARAASVLVDLVGSGRAPARLPLGRDTVARIEERIEELRAELAEWRELAGSTDHPEVPLD
ncbi:SDR family NAD(P)-dependent oxidoreductase [Plantactinospora sonchi]|uniref:SDR family NAD(P)-dependent oxidoreductase n=1 Tax=Plantactinospora sonchi TaxID=1544735 RepID=A0ABU7RNM7_9ACTN